MRHINGISLMNFRVFKNRTTFEFAPITILTGKNNAGKSSLIKGIQLIKDSITAPKPLSQLIFTGDKSKLGGFSSSINKFSASNELVLGFPFPIFNSTDNWQLFLTYSKNDTDKGYDNASLVSFDIRNSENLLLSIRNRSSKTPDYVIKSQNSIDIGPKCSFKLNLVIIQQILDKHLNQDRDNTENLLNNELQTHEEIDWADVCDSNDIKDFQNEAIKNNNIFNSFYSSLRSSTEILLGNHMLNDDFPEPRIICQYSQKSDQNVNQTLEKMIINEWFNGTKEIAFEEYDDSISIEHILNMIAYYISVFIGVENSKILKKENEPLGLNSLKTLTPYGRFFLYDCFVKPILRSFETLTNRFTNLSILEATRGLQERSYSDKATESRFNEILKEFVSLKIQKNKGQMIFINKWIKDFEFGDNLEIQLNPSEKVTSIFLLSGKDRISIADVGYGFIQLLPILLQIAISSAKNLYQSEEDGFISTYKGSVIFLEEPEVNLHPNLQSKIADLIIDACKTYNIQFIIETHSEYLIRKLQVLTAQKIITPKGVVIYYFNDPQNNPANKSQVDQIQILEDGSLSDDFGSGFFDEATNWQWELMRMKNSQNN